MAELHSGLRLFREELIEAIDRKSAPTSIGLPRLRWLLPSAAVGAAVVITVILVAGGTQATSADAATLRLIATALTPAPGTILHDRALVTMGDKAPQLYELWQQADRPSAARWIKFGQEVSSDGTNMSEYNPTSNTITVTPDEDSASRPAADIAQLLRSLVDSGHARVAGETTLNGIAVYKLTVSGAPSPFREGTAYVARDTHYPVLIESTGGPCKCTETIRFQAYEYLPASAANLRLLDLTAQHPGARVITGAPRGTITIGK
jgi:outer membrane lipoprotein-sorting protein